MAALALALPLLATAGPATAQRTAPAAAAPAALGRAYVTDPFAATVTVIDTRTFEIVTVIPVGFLAWDATLSPDESVLYVATDAGVDVIDTATNTVTTTIPVGVAPQSVAFTPDGTRAYVTNVLSDTVSVIDTATNTVVDTIALDAGSFPNEVAVSPNGTRAYVTNVGLSTVSVIDTATNTVIATIPVGVQPSFVAVSLDSTRAYVSNGGSGSVSVIDTATNTVIATIPVGIQPQGIDVAPEGSTVYVADAGTNRVAVIDVASNTVTKTLPTDIGSPINVEVTARRVYVTGGVGQLSVIDRVVEAVVKVVSIAPDPENPFFSFAFGLAVSEGPPLPGNPTITTQASPSNLEGTVFTDTATVTGGVNPTGEVIFRTYTDASCVNESGNTITRPLVNGTATAEAFLPVGTIYWRALYTGDANNNPATHPCNAPGESVVVRPFAPPPFTRVITGDLAGPVTVNNGESVQIINARVAGPITVNPGGSLVIENSQITGGIVANSPGFLRICGAQVSGPRGGAALGVFDATVPIVIGNPPNCAGNRFAGNVNLIGNYGVTFNNNIVTGSLTVNNGGPAATQLRSNTIFGNLACSGNNPFEATRPLNRNTVHGTRSGQCVAPF